MAQLSGVQIAKILVRGELDDRIAGSGIADKPTALESPDGVAAKGMLIVPANRIIIIKRTVNDHAEPP